MCSSPSSVERKMSVREWMFRMLAVAIAIIVLPMTAGAQDGDMLRLTLEDAQARAMAASHRLAEVRARQRTANAGVDVQRAAERPSITASAGYTRTSHVTPFGVPSPIGLPLVVYPDVPDNYRTRIDLQWPIYTGGRTDALERAARAESDAVATDVTIAQADLKLEVARAFWAVVTASATVTVLEESVTRAQAHVADVRERLRAGLIAPHEVASAEAQESRKRMLLIEARTQREVALAEFNRLVGSAAGESAEPLATLEAIAPASGPVDAAVAQAKGARAERVALQRRIDAAGEQRS